MIRIRLKQLFRPGLSIVPIRNLVQDLGDPNLSYAFGRVPNINSAYSPLTIGQLLKRSASLKPDQLALIVAHQNIQKTFQQFDSDVDQLTAALQRIGCGRGSMVGLWAINCYEWILTQFATGKLGSIMVALNPGYKEHELLNCLRLVQVDTLIMSQRFKTTNFPQIVENISPGIFANARGHRVQSKQLPQLKNIIVIDQQNDAEEIVPQNVCRFSELMNTAKFDANDLVIEPENQTQFDDVINVQFTSGTTGLPKGAMLTHHNIVQNAQFILPILFEGFEDFTGQSTTEIVGEKPTICMPNPLYHAMGCVLGTLAPVYAHATLVVSGPVFNVRQVYEVIQQYRCNFLYGTPTMWSDLLHGPFKEFDLTTLKRGLMSGSPCPPVLLKNCIASLGSLKHIMIPYGTTEVGPVATCTRISDTEDDQLKTVGRPIPFVEIKVIDLKNQRVVPRGQTGEVCIRSHGTFPGYINQPDKTTEVIDSNFWYHTGDVGMIDQQGYLIINGRLKEMIIRGGENIYPREVEDLILQFHNESVEDVHVVGIPDQRLGEEMVAYVKLKISFQGHLTEESLKENLKTKISHFKVPKHIRFLADFPRTPTGKVRKIDLKQMALEQFKT